MTTAQGPKPHTSIASSRVSLSDPAWNHGLHWEQLVLPRIASFVQAVYTIRGNDDKRYRLLMAMTSAGDGSTEVERNVVRSGSSCLSTKEGWKILFDECPWLLHECNDTAYHRHFASSDLDADGINCISSHSKGIIALSSF